MTLLVRRAGAPTVSKPVTWDEVAACWKKKDAARLVFDSEAVLRRVEKHRDLFEPMLTLNQKRPRPQM